MKKTFSFIHNPVLFALFGFLVVSAVVTTSCNKKFDSPPLESTDTPTVTMTIKDLKALHTTKGSLQTISTDDVISGIVTANDSSGNLYYTGSPGNLVIQDNTGALFIKIQANDIYTDYPVGRKVFIHVKGLILGDYSGTIQLGGGIYTGGSTPSVDGILSSLADNYITRGSFNNVVVPVSISDLSIIDTSMQSPLVGALVTLDSFQFADEDLGSTYADSTKAKSSVYYYLENCAGQQVELYNSSYANFAAIKVPEGKGDITGIYAKYNTTKEIFIRDTSDVKFYGPRCGGGSGPVIGDTTAINDVRKIGNGTIPNGTIIKGIVISNSNNESAGNVRIESEDGSAGVILYFNKGANSSFTVGQEIAVNVGGLSIAPYLGDLEISGVQAAEAIGSGIITPRTATIADITKNMDDWASTLVTIKNLSIKHGATGTTGETDTLSDATGSLVTFVRTTSGITLPDNASSITGYVSVYQKSGADAVAQLGLRDQNDVVSGGDTGGGDGSAVLSDDFSSVTSGNNTTSTGANSVWNGDDNFPTVTKAYSAGGMVKLGTSSAVGTLVSKPLDLSGNDGKYTVTVDVKGWTSGGSILVTSSNNSTGVTQNYTATMSDSPQTLTFDFTDGTANTTITISTTTSSYRAFIDSVSVQ